MSDEHELNELYADTPGTEQRETVPHTPRDTPPRRINGLCRD